MKKLMIKNKWIFLLLINSIPFVLNILLFQIGMMDDLFLFLPIFAYLTFQNYTNCEKVNLYILFQVFMIIYIICSGYASTYLYFHNVSSDSLTPIAGQLCVFLESAINIITTVITAIIKALKNKKSTQNSNC